jgi:hypothetical protein
MNRNLPFAISFLIATVGVALVLMLWAMQGTSSGRREFQASDTPRSTYTQTTYTQPYVSPLPAAPAPSNDTRAERQGQQPSRKQKPVA